MTGLQSHFAVLTQKLGEGRLLHQPRSKAASDQQPDKVWDHVGDSVTARDAARTFDVILVTLRTHKVPLHRAQGNETLLLLLRLSLAPVCPLSLAHAHLCAQSVGLFCVHAGERRRVASRLRSARALLAQHTRTGAARLRPHRQKAPFRWQEVGWKAAQASFRDKHQCEVPPLSPH